MPRPVRSTSSGSSLTKGGHAIRFLSRFAALTVAGSLASAARQQGFPHEEHARLFSFCTGCHEMETGDRPAMYPEPALCGRCHDDVLEPRVTWAPPTRASSNLVFDHASHASAAAADPLACEDCHVPEGAARMAVRRTDAPACLGCHAHEAREHYTDADCATCHMRLFETGYATDRITALPKPADHDSAQFLAEGHGARARASIGPCEVCHTRERCAACHVDAASVAEIARMDAAPASLILPPMAARYEEPASHGVRFAMDHAEAAATSSCGTCHTRDDCAACHVSPLPGRAAALPARAEVAAPGAVLQRLAPVSHAFPGFASDHAAAAATDADGCAACHARNSCNECHDAPRAAVFHPDNFVARHSVEAYGRRLECAGCHETQTFCRDCHVQIGMQSESRLGPAFHDAEPLWLLRHGGPARRALESCTTCHRQRDCLQCHSTLGSFRINPHASDFDARAAHRRNPIICRACHIGDPFTGTRRD
ncbi:MAG: hypothetical protein L0271_23305 [Gemmatimonadetes bacterium]|nr:hypothetical protein [Gemmatimonadota bacterium]